MRPHGRGAVFSAVFDRDGEHGLQLIHIPDGESVYIPLTDAYRVGRVWSVRITPFDSSEWLYRYRNDGRWVADPHAFALCRTVLQGETGPSSVTACSCHPLRMPVSAEPPLPPADWSAQVVYSLHVKGFTWDRPLTDPSLRGTFAGTAAMIPYLRDLGVTAVLLMPVYTPLPDLHRKRPFRTMQEALGAWPVSPQGDPMRDLKDRPNYWGFGRGLYYALRPGYGSQEDFADMVRAFHRAGIRVLLQIYFEKGSHVPGQVDVLRFYISRYGIDGFHLMGHIPVPSAIASAPSLADTALFFSSFPFEEMEEEMRAAHQLYEEDIEDLAAPDPSDPADEPADTIGDGLSSAGGQLPGSGPLFGRGQTPGAGSLPGRGQTVRGMNSGMETGSRPSAGQHRTVAFPGILTCGDDFQTLLRRFVKSDDYVMKDFLKAFLSVPENHGELRYVTTYEGFTLADLVAYSERHNEANGEFGLDGRQDNYSWNCGEEGETDDAGVLTLRRRQVRNFLTLLLLSRGTPMLRHGDERGNSQQGNNNPYCQDNAISWIDWSQTQERESLTAFTARLLDFRRDHPVFRGSRPFQYIDYLGIGYPDVSLHGEEAWKPDLGAFSHSIAVAYCENYAETGTGSFAGTQPAAFSLKGTAGSSVSRSGRVGRYQYAFTCLAINMYWKDLSLALPKLPPHYVWRIVMDTDREEGFLPAPVRVPDPHCVDVPARSVRILCAALDVDSIVREAKLDRRAALPPAGVLCHGLRHGTSPAQKGPAGRRSLRRCRAMIPPRLRRH